MSSEIEFCHYVRRVGAIVDVDPSMFNVKNNTFEEKGTYVLIRRRVSDKDVLLVKEKRLRGWPVCLITEDLSQTPIKDLCTWVQLCEPNSLEAQAARLLTLMGVEIL